MIKTHYEAYEERFAYLDTRIRPLVAKKGIEAVMALAGDDPRPFVRAIDTFLRMHTNPERDLADMFASPDIQGWYDWMYRLTRRLEGDERSVAGELASIAARNWHQLRHAHFGKHVYEVSPGLAQRLEATELRGLVVDDLRLPFPAIYIQVPRTVELVVPHHTTGMHKLIGAYISEVPDMQERPGMPSGERGWRVMLLGEGRADAPMPEWDDATYVYAVPLETGTLEDALKQVVERFRTIGLSQSDADHALKAFRFLMNVVMYATSASMRDEVVERNKARRQLEARLQKVPKGAKRQKINEALKQEPSYRRIVLGPAIKRWTDEDMVQREHGKTTKRVQVPGHWKAQAHGPKRALRKRIYIEPYWRGPELGEHDPKPERRRLR